MATSKPAAPTQYKVVAASQTNAKIGSASVYGEYIARMIVVPTSTTVGVVTLLDGSGVGAVTMVSLTSGFETELHPHVIEVHAQPTGVGATSGFHLTTGAGVTVTIVGALE